VTTAVDIVLWLALGAIGGGIAWRLTDRILEGSGAGGQSILPRCTRCGAIEFPWRRLAMFAILIGARCRRCGLQPDRGQASIEALVAALTLGLVAARGAVATTAVAVLVVIVLTICALTDRRASVLARPLLLAATALVLVLSSTGAAGLPLARAVEVPWSSLIAIENPNLRSLTGAAVSAALALAVGFIAALASGRRRIDVGAAWLAAFVGAAIGWPAVPISLVATAAVGAIIWILARMHHPDRGAPFPTGLAFAAGGYVGLLVGV
jgi:prepilin signal peptidase PulO-like enzyme (type II secretory pathway)